MRLEFNSKQGAIIKAHDGVWVVIAGRGSGKTACLIERYMDMGSRGIAEKEILNLTFTNAAATEMVKRVGLLNAEQVFRTFHSYALDLLKRERRWVPFKMTDTIIPIRGEDYQLLFELVDIYKRNGVTNFRTLQGRISEWKRGSVEPEQAIQESIGPEYYFALAYEEYERKCRERGWLDFDSLMREAVKLLENNDEVRQCNIRKYISVDECHDTDIEVRRVLDEAIKDAENSVIIARTNRQLFDVQRIATSKNIKYKNLGKKDFWEQNEVKALLNLAKDGGQHQSAATALRDIIRDHNLYGRYRSTGDLMNSDPIENLNNVVKLAAQKDMNVYDFLTYIRKLTYGRKSRKEKDLMLATVHQAKGREWKNVFLIGAEQGKMPHTQGELTEEKRIFFVACSRAAEHLHISWSGNRSMFLEAKPHKTYEPELRDVFVQDPVEGSNGTSLYKFKRDPVEETQLLSGE